ncbi:MAG TPA: hypothetical protein VIE63_13855 [Ramlibacter sp.]|jgi:uncharacterized lipoprotein YajG
MRTLLLATAVFVLAGCTVVPPQAFSFDPTHPQPRPAADPVAIAPLTNRIAELQIELDKVRAQIAQQPDTWKRLALYDQENDIHRRLDPLQHQLSQYASVR